MAKEYYNGDLNLDLDWGGNESQLPLSGEQVQKVIKDTFGSKVGYVGPNEANGMYVMTKDEATYLAYLETVTTENKGGDKTMLISEFRAPFEFSASVIVDNDYQVILDGDKNTTITFRGETKSGDGQLVDEDYTYKLIFRNGGTTNETSGKLNRGENKEINVDRFIFRGSNTITINITGRDTGVSAFKTIEVKVVELNIRDSFSVANYYDVSRENKTLTINYIATSNGRAKIKWFIDYVKVDETTGSNTNTNNGVKTILLQKGMEQGVHSLMFYLECEDQTTSDIFRTPIYYRNFFVYNGEEIITPMIGMSFTIPCETEEDYDAFIAEKKKPNVFNAKQYDKVNLNFSVYYPYSISTLANVEILEPDAKEYRIDTSFTTSNGEVYNYDLNIKQQGLTTVKVTAGDSEYVIGPFDVTKSDMDVSAVEENVVLYFDAAGKGKAHNDNDDRDVWTFTGEDGKEIAVQFNNFQWTSTSGWNDNKLVIARNTSIKIPFQPFVNSERLQAGATFEFEFNTKNVYDDDAPICSILGPNGYPGIVITASEAKFIIKKAAQEGSSDDAVSTKFKAEETNRISFVITPRGNNENRNRFVKIYVNGIICGAVVYEYTADFYNPSEIVIEGTDKAEIELNSIRFYASPLDNDQILNNYIFYRNDINEKVELYNKNKIYNEGSNIDIDIVRGQLPVMIFYQRQLEDGSTEGKIEDIEKEYADKKKTVYFDVEFEYAQGSPYNFTIERARIRPQGTSSMKYPKKNFRVYSAAEDDTILYDYEGNVVEDGKFSFKSGAQKVDCWCLKADFAESSGTHNTGTARYWNTVLKEAGLLTKAQEKAKKNKYEYDVRTTVDGYPIVLFYKEVSADKPRFIGKYNFNNDKSTEDVFGFTGGPIVEEQEVKYVEIGKTAPIVNKDGQKEGADKIGDYISNPTVDSPLYAKDENYTYYMLRGKKLFDNPKMECWEMLDSASLVALFRTVDGFGIGDGNKKVGRYFDITNEDGTTERKWEEAFESRYPDCGKYFNTNELYRLCSWMVDCLYLKVGENGESVNMTDEELFEMSKQSTLTIQSVTQYPGFNEFKINPNDDNEVPVNYWEKHVLPNTAENRKLKFKIEKYDHFDMEKMAAYYIYLMRFGGVDQTVKNAMLTTEGSRDENHPEWPSLWYFINYDNDTILGVKNSGHLVHNPYISRTSYEPGTTTFAYAGRTSTLWNNLENDTEFMDLVTIIDEKLHESTNGLSYANAIDMYNNKQAGQWSERIYNMDAQYKYIDSFVNFSAEDEKNEDIETNFLFDVQGSRTAHRKWWLAKRFNIYDSKFITGDFKKNTVIFKVNDLDRDCKIGFVSGEDIYYAITGNHGVPNVTSTPIKAGDASTLPVFKGTQIGTPLSIYGSPNIESLDMRDVSYKLGTLELGGAYSNSVGTKLKTLLVGNYETPLINVQFDTLSGLGNLEKLETLDFTGMGSINSLSDLYRLKNLKNLYIAGTNVDSINFNESGNISKIEAPSSLKTLVFNEISTLTFDNLKFYDVKYGEDGTTVVKTENVNYGALSSVAITKSPSLLNDYDFILSWLEKKAEMGELLESFTLVLNKIDWNIPAHEISRLWVLERVDGSRQGTIDIRGKITIDKALTYEEATKLIKIFGDKCFEKNAPVEIVAKPGVFIIGNESITEGDEKTNSYKVIKVGLTEGVSVIELREIKNASGIDGECGSGIHFTTNEDSSIAYITVDEVKRDMFGLNLAVRYYLNADSLYSVLKINVVKRTYPSKAEIYNQNDIYSIQNLGMNYEYKLRLSDNNGNTEFNGNYSVKWILSGEAYDKGYITMVSQDNEKCVIKSPKIYNSTFTLTAKMTRVVEGDTIEVVTAKKDMGIKDNDVLMIPSDNPAVFWLLYDKGIIIDNEKLSYTDARNLTEESLGTIFKGVKIYKANNGEEYEFTDFSQLKYFNVRSLNPSMFAGCDKLKRIELPDNGAFTVIGNDAFSGCTKLTYVNIPSSTTAIGERAFRGCNDLAGKITIPNTTVSIGKEAFYQCYDITSLEIGTNVSAISEKAFYECSSLKTVKCADSIKMIGSQAFSKCSGLTSFNIPTGISEIVFNTQNTPFEECNVIKFTGGNTIYEVDAKGNLYFNDSSRSRKWLLKYNAANTDFTSDVVYVAPYALCGLKHKDVVIPSNFILAGENILFGSTGETITLKRNFSTCEFSKGVFMKTSYESYNFAEGETIIPENCFSASTITTNSIVLPTTIKTIGSHAFDSVTGLTNLTLHENVETIGTGAFTKVVHLSRIEMLPSTPPTYGGTELFTNTGWVGIYVKGNNYKTYLEKWSKYKAYLRMWTLPDVGGFKIIENGNITFSDNIGSVVSNITVGGLPVVQKYSGFYEFKNETGNEIKNLEVLRDGKSIGRFEKLNQVFYIGDNSSLYSGNGIDFTRGIITADYLQSKGIIVKNDGWAYDGYVEAFKSQKLNDPSKQKISNVEFDIYRYAENGYITMEFGQMSEKGYDFANIIVNNKSLSGVIIDGVVVPEKNLNPDRTSDRGGVFREVFTESSIAKLPAVNSIYNFEWQIDSSNSYYIDGFWIKSIGKPVYHDPQLPSDNIITATINFSATNVISTDVMFKNIVVKVSNGASYNEDFVLTGKTLSLQLPKEDVYTVSVDNFMIGSKKFTSPSNVTIDANNGDTNIDMVFTTVASGVYAVDVNGNLTTSPVSTGNYVGVLYSTTNDDIFINKTVTKNTAWGSTSDATGMVYTKENQLLNVQYGDGFANTNNIKSYATRPIPTIIDTLSKVKDLSSTVEWYIPSYNELFVVNADSSVNNMLNSIGASSMYNTNIWTSNVEDNTHAWTFNYNPSTETPTPTSVLRSNTNNNIIIFGRFKI